MFNVKIHVYIEVKNFPCTLRSANSTICAGLSAPPIIAIEPSSPPTMILGQKTFLRWLVIILPP